MFIKTSSVIKDRLEILSKLAETAVFVVEGKNDHAALKPLVDADFYILKNKKRSIYESAEEIASSHKKAVLVLDADKSGRELTRKMKSHLQRLGVQVNDKAGMKLLQLADCRVVEGLSSRLSRLL